MQNLRKIELVLIGLYVVLTILQLKQINVSIILYAALLSLNGLWVYALVKMKDNALTGFMPKDILEKLLISFLLWGITLNITAVPNSSGVIKISLLILILYYLINGIASLAKGRADWLHSWERILLGIILTGFLFRFLHWKFAGELKMFTLLALMILNIIYGILSTMVLQKKVKLQGLTLGTAFVYFSLAFSLLFILFDTFFWMGGSVLGFAYLFFAIPAAVIFLISYATSDKVNYEAKVSFIIDNTARRLIVYNSIALFFFFLSTPQFLQLEYGNRPALIEAEYRCYTVRPKSEVYCREADSLSELYHSGNYPEGE